MSSEDASPPAPAQGATAGEIRDLNAPTHAQQTGSVTFADDVGERPLEMRSTPNLADAAMDAMLEQQKQQEGGLRSWKAMRSRAVRRQLVQMSRASTSRLSNVRKLQVPSGSAAVVPHMLAPEDIDPIAGGVEPQAPTSLAGTDASKHHGTRRNFARTCVDVLGIMRASRFAKNKRNAPCQVRTDDRGVISTAL